MPLRSHKPEWFYETLPWLYIVAGALSIVGIRNALAVFGGLGLIATGVLVWAMRRHYRRESLDDAADSQQFAESKSQDFGYGNLVWRSAYECGDKVIDDQHRELFDLANKLIDALMEGNPRSEVETQLDNFLAHIIEHFDTEEVLMNQSEHPITISHLDVHHKLLDRATELNAKYHHGDRVVRDLVQFIAHDVVAQHIILEDPKAIKAALNRL
jgi:hemerythrin-like metal-binding protein